MKIIYLDGNSLTIEQVMQIAVRNIPVGLSPRAIRAIKASRRLIDSWVEKDRIIYGVTTGFGEFSNVKIDRADIELLQQNLVISHAAGAGDPLPPEVVRAMIVLRVNALAKGYSGIRLETVEMLIGFLNRGIIPVIPSQGSVGSSGDLVQLAHLVLTMMGRGKVLYRNEVMDANLALRKTGLQPVRLMAKEGLALINGTQMMTAYGALNIHEGKILAKHADIAAALSIDALKGSDRSYDERIHKLRPYPGQIGVASNIRKLMKGSEIRKSHLSHHDKIQDAYSLRCIPQVHGASRDAIDYIYNIVSIEINSATDNPLIFTKEEDYLEGGNFHGQPVALAMDFLGIALAELANISERRIERMVNGSLSGLPRFLTRNGGLHSGLMIAQYTAASLVSENKVLAHPASVDSIPTSANQEDHNSMGSISAQKARRILHNVQQVIAIELMVACQGIDFHRPMKCGKGSETAYRTVRRHIEHLETDRVMYDDIQTSLSLLRSGTILRAVEKSVGKLF
jgi:histidine ammonia-lyase